jgi:hypothetical protein
VGTAALWQIVEDRVQQGGVNLDAAIVFDEAKLPKFVHENAYSRARRADHLGKHLLADLSNHGFRLLVLAEENLGRIKGEKPLGRVAFTVIGALETDICGST